MARTILALTAALALALPAQAAKKKAKAEQHSTTPMVTCKDGSQSPPVRGACSHHGGVGAPNDTAKPTKDAKGKVTAKGNGAITDKQETSEDIRQEKQNHGTKAAKEGGLWSKMAGRSARPPERTTAKKSGSTAPTAQCKDGSTSYSEHHSGTCSGHGGVEKWLEERASPATGEGRRP
jgi:Protein of unknown function (DUF3761)